MAKNSLGIAYEVNNRNKRKKMAEGGPASAKSEKRPMPEQKANDSKEVSENSSKKSNPKDGWVDQPTVAQAQHKPKIEAISHPKMVPSNSFSTKLYDKEGNLMGHMAPASPKDQPSKDMDEQGPNRHGPKVHPMKMMAEGGMLPAGSEDTQVEHPEGLESDNDQEAPKSADYMAGYMAGMYARGGEVKETQGDIVIPDKGWGKITIKDHEDSDMPMAEGGSVAECIMRKKKMMAEGGLVDIESNGEEMPNQYDPRNSAILRENYDSDLEDSHIPEDFGETGDEREKNAENKHDRISAMRSRMKKMRG